MYISLYGKLAEDTGHLWELCGSIWSAVLKNGIYFTVCRGLVFLFCLIREWRLTQSCTYLSYMWYLTRLSIQSQHTVLFYFVLKTHLRQITLGSFTCKSQARYAAKFALTACFASITIMLLLLS